MKATGPKLFKELKHSGDISQIDFKFMYERPDGDTDFNVEHNRGVVNATIKHTNARYRALKKAYMNGLEERFDDGMRFLKELDRKKFNPATDSVQDAAMKYFGKKKLAEIRGQEIRQQLLNSIVPKLN